LGRDRDRIRGDKYYYVSLAGMSLEGKTLHVRFKDQCQARGLVLEIGQIKDFFEELGRLMEYVRAEEAKRQAQL
jgi:hypothetical protein